jgi:hypothetical protein
MGLASPISPTGDIEGDIAGDIAVDIAGDIAGEGECTPSPMHCTRSAIILCSSSSVLLSASATMHNLHAQPSRTTFMHNLHAQPSRLALRVAFVACPVEDPTRRPSGQHRRLHNRRATTRDAAHDITASTDHCARETCREVAGEAVEALRP